MILVEKPAAPQRLSDGKLRTKCDCAAFEADPDSYMRGEKTFNFTSRIYSHPTVKDALRDAQHRKCCFCESILEANAPADIEHYRPKGYSLQGHNTQKIYPGYFWLAYDWDNLFYCCQVCNRSNKKNYFPLRDQNRRVRNHLGSLAEEAPLVLNPGGPENPRDHVHYRNDIAVGKTAAGKTTVEIVDLNRLPLLETRLEYFNILERSFDIIRLSEDNDSEKLHNLVPKARTFLTSAGRPEAKFSAMASDYLDKAGIP